ncbi:histidine kinase [Cohnella sp. GCM10012308]|uniref:histidine kinase n=1 Tax=Cohnella sp. GCM10012308 TaxID=3317329 RepID=UPI00361173F0
MHNALNAIAELCVDEPRKAEALTIDLSQYLRRSFDFKLDVGRTTIEHELELVQAYLNIEQARFGPKLQVDYDIWMSIFAISAYIRQKGKNSTRWQHAF